MIKISIMLAFCSGSYTKCMSNSSFPISFAAEKYLRGFAFVVDSHHSR